MSLNLDVAMTYLEFVEERHRIWERRQAGEPGPWTEHPILASKKFTNVFRILDPGTQYLLTDLFPGATPEEVLLRAFLYRHTGSLPAWRYLHAELGELPDADNLMDVLSCWQDYRAEGGKVFTGAYLVYPQSSTPGTDKVESIVGLTARLMTQGDMVERFLHQPHPAGKYTVLRGNKGVADFMSMQVLADWGYSQYGEDREDEYVVLGPGARRGAKALDPSGDIYETLRWAHRAVHASPSCPTLPSGRKPSWMDTQNTLCELSKLVRFMGQDRTMKPYRAANPGVQPEPVLPAHW